MRVLLVPFGSEGDVNPLIWMASGLRDRGHQCSFLLTPHYRELISGFGFLPLGTEADFQRMAGNPALWKPREGTFHVARAMFESLDPVRRVFEANEGAFDLVITSSFGFAAGCLAESRRIPHLMLHLQPVCVRSVRDAPLMTPEMKRFLGGPRWILQTIFALSDVMLDTQLLPPLNRFRRSLGLAPWKHFYRDGLMSGNGIGLLFPDWFAPPQPEWPVQARQFGFPLQAKAGSIPDELAGWLDAGEPPVVWTHGSANLHTEAYFQVAAAATRAIGGRALLVGRTPPAFELPTGMLHWTHVSFDALFPRCRAVVHHGGIGTTAKAFAAGLPQLVIPLAHDQFDNAYRVERLGAGIWSRAHPLRATADLRRLLRSPEIAAAVATWKNRIATTDSSPGAACAFAEELGA
ncbi:MAG: glycosyltransferase [Terrimicrobiaceae bacterium]|nr:glycosyltransferase [Terrimicrobiaceae bacterium]